MPLPRYQGSGRSSTPPSFPQCGHRIRRREELKLTNHAKESLRLIPGCCTLKYAGTGVLSSAWCHVGSVGQQAVLPDDVSLGRDFSLQPETA